MKFLCKQRLKLIVESLLLKVKFYFIKIQWYTEDQSATLYCNSLQVTYIH